MVGSVNLLRVLQFSTLDIIVLNLFNWIRSINVFVKFYISKLSEISALNFHFELHFIPIC